MLRSSFPATLTRVPRRTLALIVSLLLTLLCVPGGLLSSPRAFAAGTDGGFEIDGNSVSNGGDDWLSVTGVSGPVMDNNPSDTTVISAASKEDDNPSTWQNSGSAPKKVDFVNVWSYNHNQTIAGHDHPFVDLAFSRQGDTGTGGFYVELNHVQGGLNAQGAYAPTRTDGDLRFQIAQTGVNTLSLADVSEWQSGAWVDKGTPSGFDWAVNSSNVNMPGQSNIAANDFVEMSFDLYDLLGLTPSCPALFGSATIRAYTGNSNKNLEDYVSGFKLDAGSTCSSLTIEKRDSNTNKLLAGATFEISPDPTPGSNAAHLDVTDNGTGDSDPADGVITIDPAEAGTYTITEITAPPGYLIDDTNGKTVVAPIGNPAPTKTFTDSLGQASFGKVDAVSGNHIAGATFEIKATGGDAKGLGYDELVTDNDTSPGSGHVADTDPADGYLTVKNLPTGTYAVTETQAPTGYDIDNSTLTLTVSAAHPNGNWTTTSVFSDPRQKVTLTVLKIRAGTENDPNGPTVLQGAKFALYQMLGATPNPSTDTKIGTCTTGANGKCSINAEWGHSYYWVEVAPPPGYSLPEKNVGDPFDVHKSDLANGILTTFGDDSTTIATDATDSTVGGKIHDTATLGNLRSDATGTVTFQVYGPYGANANIDANSCTANLLLHTYQVNVTPGTSDYHSPDFTAPAAGQYAWVATYSGDADQDGNVRDASVAGTCGDQGETSSVGKASPTITTQASSTNSTTGTIHDTATLHGFFPPASGTVTFNLYTDCAAQPIFTSTVSVNQDGTTFTSGDYTLDNTNGTYYWSANYSGDPNNKATNQSNCGQSDANNNEISHGPVLDSPHKYNDPGSAPGASTTNTTVTVDPSNNQVHYLITVHNSGTAAMNNVVVNDPLPGLANYNNDIACGGDATNCNTSTATTTSCVSGSAVPTLVWMFNLPAGGTADLTFSVTVDPSDQNGDDISNTACVSNGGTTEQTNTVDNPVAFPILGLDKTADPVSGSTVQLGDQIDYTITVTNSGLADAPGTVITDKLPDHVTVVPGSISPKPDTVANGVITWTIDVPAATGSGASLVPGTTTLTYSVTVDQDAPEGSSLINEALVNGTCPTGSTCTTNHQVPTGDLTLVKHVDEDTAQYGDTLTYTFDASTTGNLDQSNVTVTDAVPAEVTYVDGSAGCTDTGACNASYDAATHTVTWHLGAMAHGTTRTLVFKAKIDTPPADSDGGLPSETIVNSGVVSSNETADTPSNKVKTVVETVLGKTVKRTPPPKVLPFTGVSVPPGTASMLGLLLIAAGVVLTGAFRKVDYSSRARA